jgi:hypothetical protein
MQRLLLFLSIVITSGCSAHLGAATGTHTDTLLAGDDNRLTNLKRAARYPWLDDGRCAVQESSGDWATLVERCYDALNRTRIRFIDRKGVCSVAQAGVVTADEMTRLVGICLLVQPELAVAAVVIMGAVVIAAAIATEIEAAGRAKKPGCRCSCLKKGIGPFTDFGRVSSPAVCAELCRNHEGGYTGSICK